MAEPLPNKCTVPIVPSDGDINPGFTSSSSQSTAPLSTIGPGRRIHIDLDAADQCIDFNYTKGNKHNHGTGGEEPQAKKARAAAPAPSDTMVAAEAALPPAQQQYPAAMELCEPPAAHAASSPDALVIEPVAAAITAAPWQHTPAQPLASGMPADASGLEAPAGAAAPSLSGTGAQQPQAALPAAAAAAGSAAAHAWGQQPQASLPAAAAAAAVGAVAAGTERSSCRVGRPPMSRRGRPFVTDLTKLVAAVRAKHDQIMAANSSAPIEPGNSHAGNHTAAAAAAAGPHPPRFIPGQVFKKEVLPQLQKLAFVLHREHGMQRSAIERQGLLQQLQAVVPAGEDAWVLLQCQVSEAKAHMEMLKLRLKRALIAHPLPLPASNGAGVDATQVFPDVLTALDKAITLHRRLFGAHLDALLLEEAGSWGKAPGAAVLWQLASRPKIRASVGYGWIGSATATGNGAAATATVGSVHPGGTPATAAATPAPPVAAVANESATAGVAAVSHRSGIAASMAPAGQPAGTVHTHGALVQEAPLPAAAAAAAAPDADTSPSAGSAADAADVAGASCSPSADDVILNMYPACDDMHVEECVKAAVSRGASEEAVRRGFRLLPNTKQFAGRRTLYKALCHGCRGGMGITEIVTTVQQHKYAKWEMSKSRCSTLHPWLKKEPVTELVAYVGSHRYALRALPGVSDVNRRRKADVLAAAAGPAGAASASATAAAAHRLETAVRAAGTAGNPEVAVPGSNGRPAADTADVQTAMVIADPDNVQLELQEENANVAVLMKLGLLPQSAGFLQPVVQEPSVHVTVLQLLGLLPIKLS